MDRTTLTMIKTDLYDTVKKTIAHTFNIDESIITPHTISDDIEEWDSLNHIILILKLESTFNIKFDIRIIPKLTSVNAIAAELKTKV